MSEKHIFRIEKSKNYSVMSNVHLRDETLSWKAKGIHSFVLSLPDDWEIIINHLITVSTDKETSTRSGLKELYDNKYWQKYPVYIDGKVDHWETKISEVPFEDKDIIKSIIYRDDIETINYKIDEEKLSTDGVDNIKKPKNKKKEKKNENLLPENQQVGETVEDTDVDLLVENLEVGNVDIENQGLLNTNNTKDLLFTKDLVSQSTKKEENKTDRTDEIFTAVINQAEINNYTFEEDKELFVNAIDRLLKLNFFNINGYVLSNKEIKEKLLQLKFDMCEIALGKFRYAIQHKEIKNKMKYFCTILLNAIDEHCAEDYYIEHENDNDWLK